VQIATCYADWGDVYYQQGDTVNALTQYNNVLQLTPLAAPSTALYTTTSMSVAATVAKQLIPQIATITENSTVPSADDIAIATPLIQIYGRLVQLNSGLDFWANYANAIPIWTFSYLQQVAANFAQLAQQAEQQVINFWTQAQAASLTQSQLTGQLNQANEALSGASAAVSVAKYQAGAYQDALALAQTRAADAKADATEYASTNSQALKFQTAAGYANTSSPDPLANIGYFGGIPQETPGTAWQQDIRGQTPTNDLIADLQWEAGTYSQQYQVDSMNRVTNEMNIAADQAAEQLAAANSQVTVAKANFMLACCQAGSAYQNLQTFDADLFTPQVWQSMGNFMLQIYQNYMTQGIAAAKLMQSAYNFENDTSLTFIQPSYPGVVQGLLGADALMSDIQQFTYDLATSTRGKTQLIKTSISLATNYGYQFETQLMQTGSMSFVTSLDDFDSEFPGTYQGRIKSVSVAIQGIVPPTGISGSLTNGGISYYRLPSDIATNTTASKSRMQNAETLIISDYNPSVDGASDSTTGTQLGIFEGAGVASTWTLSLPPSLNDVDYSSLTDVVLTFLYEARFDPQLVAPVLASLASRPGYYSRERIIPLAWFYPDLFYAFQASGTLTLNLAATDFPAYQTAPVTTAVGVLLASATPSALTGVKISLSPPGKTAASAATGANGAIGSQANTSLASLTGGSALGTWTIVINAAANPSLVSAGQLNLSAFNNMVLVIDYNFTVRG
jgi:hypothetical protein